MTNARNFGYRSPLLWVWTLLLGVATIPVLPQKRDSLLSLLGKTHGDSGKVDLLLQLGSVVYGHAPTEALVYCEQAEVLASRSGYRTALAEAHGWLAYLQLNYESRPDIAKSYYEKALLEWTAMLSNISTNPELDSIQVYQGFSNSIINLGYILEQESRYQEALEKYEIGAQLSAKHQLYDHVVACYLNIGNIHKAHGQIETALSRYEEALIVARSHGLIGHEAIALNAIGTLYEDNGFPLSARNYYEQALLIHRHLRDDRFVAVCLNNLGSIAQEMGNLDIAILYYDSASVLTRAIKSWDSYCIYTNNAGSALSLKGKHVEAIQLYRAAVGIATQQDHSRNMSLLHNNIAKSQLAIGLRSSAMASAELANRLAWKGGHVQDIQRSSRTLKEILMAMGRYRDAYRMLLTESKMNDSLVGAEVGRMISRSVIRAEIQEESFRDSASRVVEMSDARFAQERMLLQRKVRSDQARQVAVMSIVLVVVGATAFSLDRRRRKAHHARNAAHLQTQAWRAQVNPHFIHTALQNINDYIQTNERDLASAFLTRFARLMRAVLETARREEVPLQSDMAILRDYLELERSRLHGRFTYSIDIDPEIDVEDVLVPPMLLQPFAEEAIWQGIGNETRPGHLAINIRQQAGALLISLEDDGGTRSGASRSSQGHGERTFSGTDITKARLELLALEENRPVSVRSIAVPKGLRVELVLPVMTAA